MRRAPGQHWRPGGTFRSWGGGASGCRREGPPRSSSFRKRWVSSLTFEVQGQYQHPCAVSVRRGAQGCKTSTSVSALFNSYKRDAHNGALWGPQKRVKCLEQQLPRTHGQLRLHQPTWTTRVTGKDPLQAALGTDVAGTYHPPEPPPLCWDLLPRGVTCPAGGPTTPEGASAAHSPAPCPVPPAQQESALVPGGRGTDRVA